VISRQVDMWEKIGRNDPCPCGSGKKYKHCHGRPKGSASVDVLYVHPSKQGVDLDHDGNPVGRPYGLIPVGVVGLLNLLRENGIQVRGLNHPMEMMLDKEFDLRQWLGEQRGARVVMLDLHWYEHSYGAVSIARACKDVLPEAWTVIGGFTASAFSREILADFPEVDFVIRGDAEKPLLSLVQPLLQSRGRSRDALDLTRIPNLSYRDRDSIVENERTYCATSTDLDRLNFVDIDALEHHQQYLAHQYVITDLAQRASRRSLRGHWLCVARGCQYECAFCGGCRTAQKILAGRESVVTCSPAKVVEELRRLEEKGIEQASLSFDIAELGEEYWREFFSSLADRGVRIGIYDEFFQLPTDEFIEEFVNRVIMSHSCLALSPLSGSEGVRRLNGKYYSNDELFHTLALLKRHSVPIFVYFSLNLPGEDETAFEETLALAERIYGFYPSRLLKILNTCHTLEPYSPMTMERQKYSIEVSMSTFRDYYDYCRSTCLAGPEARTGLHRGFRTVGSTERSLGAMAEKWDDLGKGRESSWFPVPSSW